MFLSKRIIVFLIINFTLFLQLFKLTLFTKNKLISTVSTSILVFLTLYYLTASTTSTLGSKLSSTFNIIPRVLRSIMNYSRFGNGNGNYSRFDKQNTEARELAMKNGGLVGGLSNDGNTCFMNSVIQSLASSKELLKFIDSYLYVDIELDKKPNGEPITMRSNQPKPELVFTNALKSLLDSLNGKYGSLGKEFSTKKLLNKMPNGPKQNFFLGYNQEDAQEFYQLLMNLLEKEYKKMNSSRLPTPEPEENENSKSDENRFVDIRNLKTVITGCDRLGKLGTVYVPAAEVDPNLDDAEHKVMPLNLITPVDGISAEKVECLTCGEVGGTRFSVISGLSLNLGNNYSSVDLHDLLNEWIKPEVIEHVNCNRCGLTQTRDFLIETLTDLKEKDGNSNKLVEQFETRLQLIEVELKKHCVTDEAFEKLTIKKQIKQSSKEKQILLERPPSLLCIHLNRSVFDPRTYSIVKNPASINFPMNLNLASYIVPQPEDENNDEKAAVNGDAESDGTSAETESNTTGAKPVEFQLKAVIAHFGSHSYGHYICYRKFNDLWFRISDEDVAVVDEPLHQGAYMLFYELV
ncbi:Ubiquitin carboxyl-terminal hydrolase 1 [Candida viswanathii]|uniref:Ubiquitin carboxyl-terminal hydrolase n=1 Tax=Candida viswanathii TaxID=5486 RepID=A0A367YH54_9ASCO|nr:Ubiquitin carboxyl-terminal hydrolase 1 [Candida viswanathii]